MTQNERWLARYNEVMAFMERKHRKPSKYRIEEHDMLNWLKVNRKVLNAGELKGPRLGMFRELMVLSEQYKRKNQYD